jgi:hypothetical protein
LRGEYLTRIEKINNKLRNILSDYDDASINLDEFFKKSSQPKNKRELFNSVIKMLSILFKYKSTFFNIVISKKPMKLLKLSLKVDFAHYKEVDLKLTQVETVNR